MAFLPLGGGYTSIVHNTGFGVKGSCNKNVALKSTPYVALKGA